MHVHRESKKGATLTMAITLSNLDREWYTQQTLQKLLHQLFIRLKVTIKLTRRKVSDTFEMQH